MSYDYSKIAEEDWHDGAPHELEVGMVLAMPYGFEVVGTCNKSGDRDIDSYPSYIDIDWVINCVCWAWLPGFEEEGE